MLRWALSSHRGLRDQHPCCTIDKELSPKYCRKEDLADKSCFSQRHACSWSFSSNSQVVSSFAEHAEQEYVMQTRIDIHGNDTVSSCHLAGITSNKGRFDDSRWWHLSKKWAFLEWPWLVWLKESASCALALWLQLAQDQLVRNDECTTLQEILRFCLNRPPKFYHDLTSVCSRQVDTLLWETFMTCILQAQVCHKQAALRRDYVLCQNWRLDSMSVIQDKCNLGEADVNDVGAGELQQIWIWNSWHQLWTRSDNRVHCLQR